MPDEPELEYTDEDEEEDEEDYYDDFDTDEGFNRWFEAQKVDRKCYYCGCTFRGMPDHGVCNPCADKLEQGYDLEPYEGEDVAINDEVPF